MITPHLLYLDAKGTWNVGRHSHGCHRVTPYGLALICLVSDLADEQLPDLAVQPGTYEATTTDDGTHLVLAAPDMVPA
jgi:hypothetical protein